MNISNWLAKTANNLQFYRKKKGGLWFRYAGYSGRWIQLDSKLEESYRDVVNNYSAHGVKLEKWADASI